jgi:hypothetical protein
LGGQILYLHNISILRRGRKEEVGIRALTSAEKTPCVILGVKKYAGGE